MRMLLPVSRQLWNDAANETVMGMGDKSSIPWLLWDSGLNASRITVVSIL